MAAPQDAPEQAIRLRKFQGTNTAIDATFLGPSLVARSENWIPTQSYRLGKRPGTTLVQQVTLGAVVGITDLLCARTATQSYCYAYCQRTTAGGDFVATLVDEQAPVHDPAVGFGATAAVGRMVRFRDRVYCGNGVTPLVSWQVGGGTATIQTYPALAVTNTGGAQVIALDNAVGVTASVPTGKYSYAWGQIDLTSGLYVSRSAAAEVAIGAGANTTGQRLSTTAPTGALPANHAYRLFIAPAGWPIEYATAQGANYAAGEARTYSALTVSDLRCPIAGGVMRTGNMLLVWRNRVVFAGAQAEPTAVFATDILLPGLEQATYNQGTFFPVHAKVPLPAAVTGIGVAGVTTGIEAQAPLVFFTLTRTFVCTGDPFSVTEPATLVEVSSRVGCIGHDSIVNTPAGLIFCGLDSVYLVPPGGGYPQDIGWPIADRIRAIPVAARSRVTATFHKQFYKLAFTPAGETANVDQWWLDLRQGIGDTPAWWGPHTGTTATACAVDLEHPAEQDRGYAALPPDRIVRTHQTASYTDYDPATPTVPVPITSRLWTGRFDADQPFLVKVFTRLRLIAQTAARSAMLVTFLTDGGVAWTVDPIQLGAELADPGRWVHLTPLPSPPPNQSWNTAQFGTMAPVEVQTITPYTRPRGLSARISLTHGPELDAQTQTVANVELRDFEVLFLISDRKVRYLGERISK